MTARQPSQELCHPADLITEVKELRAVQERCAVALERQAEAVELLVRIWLRPSEEEITRAIPALNSESRQRLEAILPVVNAQLGDNGFLLADVFDDIELETIEAREMRAVLQGLTKAQLGILLGLAADATYKHGQCAGYQVLRAKLVHKSQLWIVRRP